MRDNEKSGRMILNWLRLHNESSANETKLERTGRYLCKEDIYRPYFRRNIRRIYRPHFVGLSTAKKA